MVLAAARSANAAHQRDQEQAVQAARYALAGLESLYGPDHPNTQACANNTAVYLLRAGNPGEARALFERARAGFAETLGHDDPRTRAAEHNLALTARPRARRRDARGLAAPAPRSRNERSEVELPPIPLWPGPSGHAALDEQKQSPPNVVSRRREMTPCSNFLRIPLRRTRPSANMEAWRCVATFWDQ